MHRTAVALALACTAAVGSIPDLRGQEPAASPGQATATAAGQPEARSTLVRGQLLSRYWLRWTGDTTDQDIYETLSMDIGDPDRDAVTGYLQGSLSADLDGRTGDQPFASLDDSFNGAVTAHLHYAYADLHRVPGFTLLRAGRQVIYDTPEMLFFDGLRGETEPVGDIEAQLGLYGGMSTHFWEASPRGDWMTGLYLQGRPWSGGRLRLDWAHLEDETLTSAHANDLFGAGAWQSIGDKLRVEAQYTRVEDRDRDVTGRAFFTEAGSGLLLQASYYQLLRTQRELVVELDPYYASLLELFPYRQVGFLASKSLWEQLDLRAGADLRRVSDRADVGQFNRDYERYFATVAVIDALAAGLTASFTLDSWDSDQQHMETWGADLSYRLDDGCDLSAGTYYSLYKYDLMLNREQDHVRTYYARVCYKASQATTLDLSYDIEDNDFDLFHRLRMGVTWRF